MSSCRRGRAILWSVLWMLAAPAVVHAATPEVDLSAYQADSGVKVERLENELRISWPIRQGIDDSMSGSLVLDLRAGRPLIRTMGFVYLPGRRDVPILKDADPVTYLLVGSREAPAGRPPGMSVFNVFFDSPAKRPYQTFR